MSLDIIDIETKSGLFCVSLSSRFYDGKTNKTIFFRYKKEITKYGDVCHYLYITPWIFIFLGISNV